MSWVNPVRARLEAGEPVLALTLTTNNIELAAVAATLGFHFLWVEMGALADYAGDAADDRAGDARTAGDGIRTRAGRGVWTSPARPSGSSRDFSVLLDCGSGVACSAGVQVPAGRKTRIGRGL